MFKNIKNQILRKMFTVRPILKFKLTKKAVINFKKLLIIKN